MTLKELRELLLRIDHPEQLLVLADNYMAMARQMGDEFRLPKEHAVVRPLVEYYTDDLPAWVKFIKNLRAKLPMRGRQFHPGVNQVLRTIETRYIQQQRRERLDRAVGMALKKRLIPDTYADKMAYARRCTQVWKSRRDNLLKTTANQTKSGAVSVAEREGLLSEFWHQVDAEIQNGEVPKP